MRPIYEWSGFKMLVMCFFKWYIHIICGSSTEPTFYIERFFFLLQFILFKAADIFPLGVRVSKTFLDDFCQK